MFVTRKQYDKLVQSQPTYMITGWLALRRRWSTTGIYVTGGVAALDRLRRLIADTLVS